MYFTHWVININQRLFLKENYKTIPTFFSFFFSKRTFLYLFEISVFLFGLSNILFVVKNVLFYKALKVIYTIAIPKTN